ncbi:MAG: hypothetical protein WKF37_17635 [Bryobacteraceae bacterium]
MTLPSVPWDPVASAEGRVEFEAGAEPLRFDNVFAGDFNVPLQASLSTSMPIAHALQNSLDDLRLKSIVLNVEAQPDKRQATIEQVWASSREARPGDTLQISIMLAAEGGKEITKVVAYHVPQGFTPGPLFFTAADGPNTNAAEQRFYNVSQAQKGDRLVETLNQMRPSNRAYLRVWRSDPAYTIDGRSLPDPPPSVGMILARGPIATASQGRTSTLAEIEFVSGDSVISGAKTLQVDIKE